MAFHLSNGKVKQTHTLNMVMGFTLLEVLIAVLLLSILSMIAAPSFQRWQERHAFKHFATHFANLARHARIYALTHKKPFYLIAKVENTHCVMISDDEHCTCSTHQSCAVNDAAYWEPPTQWSTQLATLNGTDKTVAFNQHGTLNFGSNTTFTLASQHFNGKVTINALGRVKLCSVQSVVGVASC
ncbi:hypothetical protein I533_12720 [Alteromonas mediterranea MED64]|uniref:prepilin-type N-terminal cleavage/methylation domain-containing protein n=1 Tax=Alteromonas mediterranea TaxID=314275 RepID=UPI00035557BA|nr:prepilin-type N-terminal cleavage/methylation domain-containing protein [Alteromonas mediterranea]AGP82504.1 hypothetical protein I533_12720 [Alteromonas mediterranea MED64]